MGHAASTQSVRKRMPRRPQSRWCARAWVRCRCVCVCVCVRVGLQGMDCASARRGAVGGVGQGLQVCTHQAHDTQLRTNLVVPHRPLVGLHILEVLEKRRAAHLTVVAAE